MKGWEGWIGIDRVIYLSESLVVEAVWVFFLFGVGILHSIWKATQLVQGTPREAASQRTFLLFNKACQSSDLSARDHLEALVLSSSACGWGAGLTGGCIAKPSRARDLDLGCPGHWVAWSRGCLSTVGLTYAWQVYFDESDC
jgi:hypothetical protein